MNRFTFRFWNSRDKKMITDYGSSTHLFFQGFLFTTDLPRPPLHNGVKPYVIPMMFTGKKDKNNLPVFEGDIVRGESLDGLGKEVVGEVYWNNLQHSFRIKRIKTYTKSNCSLRGIRDMEVIGNIYENA